MTTPVAPAAAGEGYQDEQHQVRGGHDQVDQRGDHGVGLFAEGRGQGSENRGNQRAENGGQQSDGQAPAKALDRSDEHVAPEPVRSERELRARGQLFVQEIGGQSRVAHHGRGDDQRREVEQAEAEDPHGLSPAVEKPQPLRDGGGAWGGNAHLASSVPIRMRGSRTP